MRITKRVDVENIDVGRSQGEVLQERGEHVPRVEEQEGDHEVEDVGRDQGDDEREEDLVLEKVLKDEDAVGELVLDGFDGDEDRCEKEVADPS